MNKVDDILEKLKNTEQPQIDLTEEIMNSLSPRPLQEERELKRSVLWPYAVSAIAAGIILLLVFNYNNKVEPVKQPVVAEVVEQQPAPEASTVSDYCENSDNSEPSEPTKPKRTHKPRKVSKPVEEPLLAEAETVEEFPTEAAYQEFLDKMRKPSTSSYATQTQEIRERGEQVTQYVAMLNQQIKTEQQYVEY